MSPPSQRRGQEPNNPQRPTSITARSSLLWQEVFHLCTSPTKEILLVDQKVEKIGASYSRAGGAEGGVEETLVNHQLPTSGCLRQGPDLQGAGLRSGRVLRDNCARGSQTSQMRESLGKLFSGFLGPAPKPYWLDLGGSQMSG